MEPENELFFRIFKKLEPDYVGKKIPQDLLTESKLESAKQLAILSDAFVLPLHFLRSFGNNPYTFTKVEDESTGVTYKRFDFKWKSWIAFYSLLGQLFYVGGFIMLVNRLFTGHYKSSVIPGSDP